MNKSQFQLALLKDGKIIARSRQYTEDTIGRRIVSNWLNNLSWSPTVSRKVSN